jgi:hypothetical protein
LQAYKKKIRDNILRFRQNQVKKQFTKKKEKIKKLSMKKRIRLEKKFYYDLQRYRRSQNRRAQLKENKNEKK